MTLTEIQALHQKYAPSRVVYDLVFTHCLIVRDIAQQLIAANHLDVDDELVETGCLLHDVGVYPLFDADGSLRADEAYISHGIKGEAILKQEGLSENVWRIASHHTGVGLKREDIEKQKLPLPPADYLAESDEERLVMYADKFHSKTTPPHFNSYQWYRQEVARFGDDKVAQFDQLAHDFGIPDLAPFSSKIRLSDKIRYNFLRWRGGRVV